MITGTFLHIQVKVLTRNKIAELFGLKLSFIYLSLIALPVLHTSSIVISCKYVTTLKNNMSYMACLLFTISFISEKTIRLAYYLYNKI